MSKKKKAALGQAPKFTRVCLSKEAKSEQSLTINPGEGMYGAGLIEDFAVITRGEALGHDTWIDNQFLHQVSLAVNSDPMGSKSRFTHPGLSSDGLGKFLGRTKDAKVDGDVVRADQHIAASAKQSPDGDLAKYVMTRAKEDPASFGASIVFEHDADAEDAFIAANGGDVEYDRFGRREVSDGFKSPDPLNVNNYPHARLKELRAVDLVDDPAANPSGLYHVGQEIPAEAEALTAFALGLSDTCPPAELLGIDPNRAHQFISRFLDRHDLALVSKSKMEAEMPENEKPGDEKPADEVKPAEVKPAEVKPTEEKPAEVKPETEKPAEEKPADKLAEGKRFLDAFGDKGGRWFAEGKTFEEAQALHSAALKADNDSKEAKIVELQKQLRALRGEAEPVSFTVEPTAKELAAKDLTHKVGGPGLATYAASLELPGRKQ